MSRCSLFFGVMVWAALSYGQPQEVGRPIVSADLKSLVETQNRRVKSKAEELEGAHLRTGSLGRSFLPRLEIHAAQEDIKKGSEDLGSQPSYGAEVSVNLYNGGRDQLEEEILVLRAEKVKYERAQIVSMELEKAREAYWRILFYRDYIDLLESARKSNEQALQAAKRRIRNGLATDADRMEFEMQDVEFKLEVERLRLARDHQVRRLGVLLGMDAVDSLIFSEALEHNHNWTSTLEHEEDDHMFLVKPALLEADVLSAKAKKDARQWWPQVDAYAEWNQWSQSEEEARAALERREQVAGLRLRMDFSSGVSGRREAAALRAEEQASRHKAAYTENEVDVLLHGNIAELNLLDVQVHEAEENVERAQRYHQLTESEYRRGVKNSPDMLGALVKLVHARAKSLEIVRDFQIAKSRALSKMGR